MNSMLFAETGKNQFHSLFGNVWKRVTFSASHSNTSFPQTNSLQHHIANTSPNILAANHENNILQETSTLHNQRALRSNALDLPQSLRYSASPNRGDARSRTPYHPLNAGARNDAIATRVARVISCELRAYFALAPAGGRVVADRGPA